MAVVEAAAAAGVIAVGITTTKFANSHMIPQQPSFGEEQTGQTGRGSPSYEPMKAAEGIDAGANLQHRGEDAIEGETTNAADDTNEAVANGEVQHSVEGEQGSRCD
ncbi:hypothetical protein KC324_g27 [Hortaea werneckii]|nr:hypothetical protein KC324_g27 [Hortaea werneckii]